MAKRNGAFAVRFCLLLRVVRVAMLTALAGNPCTIPFCPKRMALDREGNCHRQGTWWLVRTGWQNGIPYTQGRALAGGSYFDSFKIHFFNELQIQIALNGKILKEWIALTQNIFLDFGN